MRDKQNPSLDEDESLPAREAESDDQIKSSPKGYYYDDATGYEIYKEEDETDEDVDAGQSE